MATQTVKERIYYQHFRGFPHIRYADLPIEDMQADDIISISRQDAFYSENNSCDAYTELEIFRERPETKEETAKRKKEWNDMLKERKGGRYANYLKLKEEFENK